LGYDTQKIKQMKAFQTAKVMKLLGKFAIVSHLSRQKCFTSIILAMIETRRVQFSELGLVFNDDCKPKSNEHRIQRFFAEAELDEPSLTLLLSLFLTLGKVELCMDRTEWDFGGTQVNLLVLSAYCNGIGMPLYIKHLDNNSGNSATSDRILMLKKAIALLGKSRICGVCADREFVGHEWIDFLRTKRIPFFIRLPKSYLFTLSGHELKAESLLGDRKECKIDNISVLGIKGLSVAIKRVQCRDGKQELLIVLTNTFAYMALRQYKKRWSIEAMFQDFKGQGFNIEETHIPIPSRIVKMVYLVAVAYGICIQIGIMEEKANGIPMKNHGYRAKSLFRRGLDRLRTYLLRKSTSNLDFWHDIIDQFIEYAVRKIMITNILYKS
jgi:Transposase DDE domain